MQVDPIKLTLQAPGTQRLKLKGDKLLSSFAFNFAFKFNLRRYTEEDFFTFAAHDAAAQTSAVTAAVAAIGSSESTTAAATNPRLHDVCVVALRQHAQKRATDTKSDEPLVGRCRLT